jgi:hypothetical protein
MILEALTYLTTPCPYYLRRLGYLGELIGIAARHRRCRAAWAEHLANSRAVIEEAIALTPGRARAVVLGSGLLADVPLAALAAAFAEVVLIDLVHLRATRRLVRGYRRVRLVEADVTGILEPLARAPLSLPAPRATLGIDAEADLVVSANLLSQLPILPIVWLDRQRALGAALSAEAIVAYGRALIEDHLALLGRLPGVVALTTDVERLNFAADRPDALPLEREDALLGATLPWSGRSWIWRIAPAPELGPGLNRYHRVVGIPAIGRATAHG